MSISVRPLVLVATALVIAACSGSGGTAPKPPTRAALNGNYACYRVDAFYADTAGVAKWRYGPCANYGPYATNGTRTDSIETVPFGLSSDDLIRRTDFAPSYFAYDSTTGIAIESFKDRPADTLYAFPGMFVVHHAPFDFNGDGRLDTLRVTFQRVQ